MIAYGVSKVKDRTSFLHVDVLNLSIIKLEFKDPPKCRQNGLNNTISSGADRYPNICAWNLSIIDLDIKAHSKFRQNRSIRIYSLKNNSQRKFETLISNVCA